MDVQTWLDQMPPEFYWAFIFFSSFVENIFPPYPGDTVTVLGGYLAGIRKISLIALAASVFLGSLSGAVVMYFFGQRVVVWLANKLKIKAMSGILEGKNFRKAQRWFEKYGFVAVLASRFSAGVRFFVSIVAGMTQMRLVSFVIAFSLATIIWNTILIFVGHALGENWSQIFKYLEFYNGFIIAIVIVLLGFVIYKKQKKKTKFSHSQKS